MDLSADAIPGIDMNDHYVFVGGVRLGVWGVVLAVCVCVGGVVLCRCVYARPVDLRS